MKLFSAFFTILVACYACNVTETATEKNKFGALVDPIFAEFADDGSPGCAVAVFSDDEILFMKGYGLANIEHEVSITPETVFDIASVSKQFAAYAAADLIERNAISASDPVGKYLPELGALGSIITVEHLIHHTSGLRDWPQTLAVAGWSMEDELTYEQVLRMAFGQHDLNYQPGEEYSYTNTGYVLLAELISRVSEEPFSEYINRLIYQPLGMTSSYFNHDIHSIIPRRAQSYYNTDEPGSFVNYADNTTAMGSSSMFSSVKDLATWLMFLARNQETDPVVSRMHQRGVLNNGDTIHYAYGIWYEAAGGLPVVTHTGSWAGFRAITMRFPANGLGLVILSNYGNFDRYGFAEKLAKVFLADDYTEEQEQQAEADDSVAASTDIYLASPGRIAEVTHRGPSVKLTLDGASEYEFTPNTDGEFEVDDLTGLYLKLNADGLYINGTKAVKLGPPASSLSSYTGSFYSDELMASYQLVERDGQLIAYNLRHGEVLLTPLAGDIFSGSEWFLGRVLFTRNQDGVTGFQVFGGRVRRLHFNRVSG